MNGLERFFYMIVILGLTASMWYVIDNQDNYLVNDIVYKTEYVDNCSCEYNCEQEIIDEYMRQKRLKVIYDGED